MVLMIYFVGVSPWKYETNKYIGFTFNIHKFFVTFLKTSLKINGDFVLSKNINIISGKIKKNINSLKGTTLDNGCKF